MLSQYTRIPNDRIGAVIGPDGKTKKEIETKLNVKLNIDSRMGDFEVIGEPIAEQKAKDIITAIARGFSPAHAFKLMKDDYFLHIIWLKEELGKKPKAIKQKKARIIGSHGAVRGKIEEETDALISVYGNTVAIIGKEKDVDLAEQAIERIIGGSKIGNVYGFLEEKKKQLKKFEL